MLAPGMKCLGCHFHDHVLLRRAGIAYFLLSQGQVYLRFARNTTTFKHFLASFSDIVAKMSENLSNEGSGEQQKNKK